MALTQVSTGMIADGAVTLAKLGGDVNLGLSTGEILMSTASSKTGYLLCDGSIYSRASYTALAAAIGTPVSPVATLGNSSTAANNGLIFEANGLLFKNGSAVTTTATAANGIVTSTDGITWTARTGMNMGGSLHTQNAAYGNSVYVLNNNYNGGGTSTYYQTTPDGVTFTTRSISLGAGTLTDIRSVAYGGTSNRHVMCYAYQSFTGCTQTAYTVRLVYSTDGVTWTTGDTNTISSASTYFAYADVAGYSGGFVSVQYRSDGVNYIKYSADGATWTDITSNVNSVAAISGAVRYVSYVNGRFIIVTTLGQIYTSTTGASGTWSQIVASNTAMGAKVRGNSTSYIMAVNNLTYFSQNLIDWTVLPNLGLGAIYVTATPSTGTRFYGTLVTGNANAYYADIYNYTIATQFPVPKLSTNASGSLSSPNYQNNIPVNYLIKT